jgi:hypothetical protein
VALVDQVTGTQAVDPGTFVPSATGSNNGGVGFVSDANFKDIYGRLSYRVNLERDKQSRQAIQAAGATGPREHTYINLGSFAFYGRSVQRVAGELSDGTPVVLTAREPFYRVGGDLSFNYRTFNIYGLFMYGRDHNLVPIDDTGAIIGLPVGGGAVPVGFIRSTPSTFSGGFIQADYLVLPWIMAIMRYDAVNSTADRLNGLGFIACPSGTTSCTTPPSTSFMLPFHRTRSRFTPGVQFLVHANIKASFEYQIRPQQVVTISTNPLTGLPIAVSPFRTNTAVVALEFVY